MPITIESVLLEGTVIAIYLVIILAINTFEGIHIRFVFQSLESSRIYLKIGFVVPSQVIVVYNFMQAVTFLTLSTINLTYKSSMFLFPIVVTLGDTKVHVGFMDHDYMVSDIEAPIYQHFCIQAVLEVPNVNPYDCHV